MTTHTAGGNTATYKYRADGMRAQKARTANDRTACRYDGQMPMEEFNYLPTYPSLTAIKVIRYGPGARRIDYIQRARSGGGVLTGFPVYDGHGNMVATLLRNGTSYALGDQRSYDAWGRMRTGNTTGEPNARYVANLGHLQDDESGLV